MDINWGVLIISAGMILAVFFMCTVQAYATFYGSVQSIAQKLENTVEHSPSMPDTRFRRINFRIVRMFKVGDIVKQYSGGKSGVMYVADVGEHHCHLVGYDCSTQITVSITCEDLYELLELVDE